MSKIQNMIDELEIQRIELAKEVKAEEDEVERFRDKLKMLNAKKERLHHYEWAINSLGNLKTAITNPVPEAIVDPWGEASN